MNFNKKTTTNMTLVTAALAAGLLTSPAMADREYRWAGPVWDGETQYCGWLPGWGSPDNWWWSNGIPNRPNDWANFRTNDVFGFTVIALGEGNVGYWNLDRIEISTDYRVHLRNCRGTAKFTFHSPSHLPFLKITGNGNHQIDTRVEYSPLGGIIRNSALLTFGEDSGFLFPSGAYGPLYLGNADPNDHGVTVFEGDASEWAGAEGEVIIIVGEDHTLEAGANDSLPNDGAVVVGFNGHLRIVDDETVGLISGEGDIQLYADLVFGGETRGALWSYRKSVV